MTCSRPEITNGMVELTEPIRSPSKAFAADQLLQYGLEFLRYILPLHLFANPADFEHGH